MFGPRKLEALCCRPSGTWPGPTLFITQASVSAFKNNVIDIDLNLQDVISIMNYEQHIVNLSLGEAAIDKI